MNFDPGGYVDIDMGANPLKKHTEATFVEGKPWSTREDLAMLISQTGDTGIISLSVEQMDHLCSVWAAVRERFPKTPREIATGEWP